ncbi:MAG: hypothetical protein ACKVTZ_05955 [Bacteroidia bacterium]
MCQQKRRLFVYLLFNGSSDSNGLAIFYFNTYQPFMTISGFSYIRNGFTYGYPFLQAIQSILPICDEFVVAIGDSVDGTREAILALNSPKIKIVDTVWDENLRREGKIFAQQSNAALMHCTGDWLFHIQADEIIHERDLPIILAEIQAAEKNPQMEGLLFDFLNFHGSYDYLNNTRKQHLVEIRVFRKGMNTFAYKDSQGFRNYSSYENYLAGEKGNKLKVKYIKVPVFHYNYVRDAAAMQKKSHFFEKFWHDDAYLQAKYQAQKAFDFYHIERIKKFEGSHPQIMHELIAASHFDFDPTKIYKKLSLKEKLVYGIEDIIGRRIGAYRNYVKIASR